jgi:hypothetical protein
MKLFSFATIVAVAGIAQVLAVPLVLVPESNIPSVTRPGHHVPDGTDFIKMKKKGPCRAHRLSQKAVELSNLLRQAFGLPLIKAGGHPGLDDGKIRILPFIGTPNTVPHGKDTDGFVKVTFTGTPNHGKDSVETPHDRHPHHHGHHANGRHRHHKGHHHHLGKGSFINRIHYSIMNLGRWEGRAVAFVLGCGIGVLFRMLFVLGVVMYRAVKGRGEEQHEYSQITIIEEIVDSPKSSPPSYADEKYPIVVETPKSPNTPEESK